jgi:hypothetical protein
MKADHRDPTALRCDGLAEDDAAPMYDNPPEPAGLTHAVC